uniref:DNA-directed RNA polymerase I subunit RPA49 n=1 Tax=Setaria digitata TaxID=48799 RepID=A0A915PK49_9BILA
MRVIMIKRIKEECLVPSPDGTAVVAKATGVVARLTSNMTADVQSLIFQRHKLANGTAGYVYTAKNSGPSSERVVRLGREECSEDEGCDYAIAVVNRRTGKMDCFPTKLICFENVAASDFQTILDTSYKRKIDYSLDYTISKESWADKRRALTDDFGSVKKIKILDAAKRRQIKDETLSVMMNSIFGSTSVKKEDETVVKPVVSLLTKTGSSVLPKANMDVKSPRDVYLFSNFLSEAEVITFKSEAFDYLNSSRKELIAKGLSPLVCDLIGNISTNTERTCYLLLLDAMVHCYKILSKRRFLLETDWVQLHYPLTVLTKMRELFFPGEFVSERARGKRKLAVNLMDKDRLLAHILCLAIILDYENMVLPITPWAKELGAAEPKITKIAAALGCNISAATASEGVRLGTIRIARLAGPPQPSKKRFFGRPGAGKGS